MSVPANRPTTEAQISTSTQRPRAESGEAALKAAHALARAAAQIALTKKAVDVVILHVGEISPVTDYFVIATGNSEPQVRAIANEIEDKIRETRQDKPWHVEGMQAGTWVLMDYVNVVIHIFQPETRDYYLLERLWGDARREVAVDVGRGAPAPAPVAAAE